MKKVFVAIALTTFVGSMATTAYAVVNGTQIVKKDDESRQHDDNCHDRCDIGGVIGHCGSVNDRLTLFHAPSPTVPKPSAILSPYRDGDPHQFVDPPIRRPDRGERHQFHGTYG